MDKSECRIANDEIKTEAAEAKAGAFTADQADLPLHATSFQLVWNRVEK